MTGFKTMTHNINSDMKWQNMNADAHQNSKSMTARARKLAPLGILLLVMAIGYALGLHNYLSLSALVRQRMALLDYVQEHAFLAFGIFVVSYVVAVALSFPGASLLTIAGGFLFGGLWGGIGTLIGATIGASLIFLAAKTSLGEPLQKRAAGRLDKFSKGFKEDAFSYLLFLRLTPIFPFWLVNIAPALLGVPFTTYVLATAVGIAPGTFAYSFVGAGLDSVIAAQEAANPGCSQAGTCEITLSSLVTPTLLIAFAALGFVALIPVVARKWRRKKLLDA
jgi:uncharacterized membrane protein YdjX (TVP38/TMEM64 family)